MQIKRATPVNELLAKLIFLILPTALIGYFLLQQTHQYFSINPYYSILPDQAMQQTLYFAAGMVGGVLFYAFRFRFLPTFILLMLGFYMVYQGLDRYAVGEFDAFFISVQFLVFSVLFTVGWFTGYGFLRLRYWSIIVSAVLLAACILLIAKANTTSVNELLWAFLPALLYSIYIIFTAEQIYNYKDKSQKFWWFLTRRLVFFGILAALTLGGVVYMMQAEIKETVDNYGGGGKEGDNSMLKKNDQGRFDLKDYTRLRSSLGRSNELLFCAHIDNFFDGTDIPNPLYLTAFYYTKFDTLTETFERDKTIPYNDLFEPDPGKIPLFSTQSDSSVIENSLGPKLRRTVEIEVYNKQLSGETFVAPNVGYFVQPITVEKDFKDEFVSAYRAKSYVSDLNSAYFVYNADDPQIKAFQEMRFEVLRKIDGYENQDPKFMQYYTYMPGDNKFASISQLAHEVTKDAEKPIDKVLAIRDYFLSKDELGQPLFKYTDNPGVPDIPNASKLMYFLFENRQGYCAYYAGATLFMLRSLGIPSRIAVGFLTVDRSDKNKGWYWYYADQAHAWVQVYFPGYGWLDFDTTVGNSDAEESPKPDGTPPMQPPKAWLAADGIVVSVDTLKKLMVMNVNQMVFHDKEYKLSKPVAMTMDMKIAAVRKDSIDIPLSSVVKGDEATAVSYAEAMKKMEDGKRGESGESIIARMPAPVPIDELYVKRKDLSKPEEQPQALQKEEKIDVERTLLTVGIVVAVIIILLFALPYLVWQYYRMRYRQADKGDRKAYWGYRAATFYLHQLGYKRGNLTPMQYAVQVADPALGTKLQGYMNVYLKQKYSKQPLTTRETEYVSNFMSGFVQQVRSRIKPGKRLKQFLKPWVTAEYFMKADEKSGEA